MSAGVDGSGSALAVQAVTVGMVTWRRHLPTWSTSGMLVPLGTPHGSVAAWVSVKLPLASVSAPMTGLPEAGASHCVQVGLPARMGSGLLLGM